MFKRSKTNAKHYNQNNYRCLEVPEYKNLLELPDRLEVKCDLNKMLKCNQAPIKEKLKKQEIDKSSNFKINLEMLKNS